MGGTVRQRRDGVGTAGPGMGRETVEKGTRNGTVNTRGWNKIPYGGTVDCGNRNQGLERSRNKHNTVSCSRPVPALSTFSFPELCRAQPCTVGTPFGRLKPGYIYVFVCTADRDCYVRLAKLSNHRTRAIDRYEISC